MTIFNPKNETNLTYGQIMDPAMKITDPADAKQYFQSYVEYLIPYIVKEHEDADDEFIYMESVTIAKHNLGYYAGYYDNETRKRVEKLFECSHPIFGSIEINGEISPESAFELGKKVAIKRIREIKLKKIDNNESDTVK